MRRPPAPWASGLTRGLRHVTQRYEHQGFSGHRVENRGRAEGGKLLAAVNRNAQTGDVGLICGSPSVWGSARHSSQSRMPLKCPVGLQGQTAEVFTSAYGFIRSPVGIIHSAAFTTPSNGPDYIESNAVPRRHPTLREGSPGREKHPSQASPIPPSALRTVIAAGTVLAMRFQALAS